MRWIVALIAGALSFASPSRAAVYDFNLVIGGPNDEASGYIDLAIPTGGQGATLTLTTNNPDGAPYVIFEDVQGVKKPFGAVFDYAGGFCDPAICTGLLPSQFPSLLPSTLSLGNGAIRIVFTFAITSPSDQFTADFQLTIPDELQPSAVTAIPELSTWAMMLLGFAGVGIAAYRRSQFHCTNPLPCIAM